MFLGGHGTPSEFVPSERESTQVSLRWIKQARGLLSLLPLWEYGVLCNQL